MISTLHMTAPLILPPIINQEKRPKTPETNLNPKECNTNMAGKTGELHLQAVLNYIDDWVGHTGHNARTTTTRTNARASSNA